MSQILVYASEVAADIPPEGLVHVLTGEEIPTCEKVEEDGPERKDVCLVAVALLEEHLGRHVARRATLVLEHFVRRSEHRKTEVCDADLVLAVVLDRVDKYVFRLNIPMNDPLLLEEVECEEHLFHKNADIGLLELLVRLKRPQQGPIRHVLENHIDIIVVLENLEQPHN